MIPLHKNSPLSKSLPILIFVLVLSACTTVRNTTNTNPGNELLFLSRWDLTSLEGKAFTGSDKPYLVFAAGESFKVTGFGGCNMFFGGFTLTGVDSIDFGTIGSTMMYCDAMSTETALLSALEKATKWKIDNNVLTLYTGETALAIFTGTTIAAFEEAATMRTNGTWELSYLTDMRGTLDGGFPNGLPTLIISMPNTKATGNGGCNSYSADIKIENNNMRFGPISATKMYCENTAESIFFGNLSKVTAWTIEEENQLTLYNNDVVMMRMTRK